RCSPPSTRPRASDTRRKSSSCGSASGYERSRSRRSSNRSRNKGVLMKHSALAALVMLSVASPAWAYIAAMPTLGKIITGSSHIVVLQVDKVNREKQVVIFKKVADLKGKSSTEVVKHKLTDGSHPRQSRTILDWA